MALARPLQPLAPAVQSCCIASPIWQHERNDDMIRFQRVLLFGLCASIVAAVPARAQRFSDWSAPVNIATVNSTNGDFFAAISKDDLSLYFTSPRPGGYGGWDIWVSQRASADGPWGPPQNLGPTVNSASNEGGPGFSNDGHRMYFASDRIGGEGGNDLYVSRRRDKRDDLGWQAPLNLGNTVNTPANEASPAIFADETTGELTLYFDSNRVVACAPGHCGPFTDDPPNRNGNDLYSSVLLSDDVFDFAQLVAEVSTGSFDRQPAIRRDGLELFLASDRPGGLGALDLWSYTRASTLEPWSNPVNLGPVVNSAPVVVDGVVRFTGVDAGPALSFDGTTLYFHSARPGTFGNFDLYVTTRTKLKGRDAEHD
jgi:hypothetical protein